MTLQQAIGRKSPITTELGFFGTKDKIVALTSFKRQPELKKLLIAATTSPPIIGQAALNFLFFFDK